MRTVEELLNDYDPETKPTGALESGARGALQGVTLGLSDEISGGLEHVFTGKPYAQARDEARAANELASKSNPWTYGLSEAGGGIATALVPGVGGAGLAGRIGAGLAPKVGAGLAGVLGTAAVGAGTGAVAGYGASKAEDAGGIASDVGAGALAGGGSGAVLGGLAKAIGYAPRLFGRSKIPASFAEDAAEYAAGATAKADVAGPEQFSSAAQKYGATFAKKGEAASAATEEGSAKLATRSAAETALKHLQESGVGSGARVNNQVMGKLGARRDALVETLADDNELRQSIIRSVESPGPRPSMGPHELAERRIADLGKSLAEEVYAPAQAISPGAPLPVVLLKLGEVKKRFGRLAGTRDLESAVGAFEDTLLDTYRGQSVEKQVPHIPFRQLREEISSAQGKAYGPKSGNPLTPSDSKKVEAEISKALSDALDVSLEKVAEANPGFGSVVPKMKELNAKIAPYYGIRTLLADRVQREASSNRTVAGMLNRPEWSGKVEEMLRKTQVPFAASAAGPTIQGGRWASATVFAAKARKVAREAAEALREADAATPGAASSATPEIIEAVAAMMAEASQGAGKSRLQELALQAISLGVPRAVAQRVVEDYP